MFCNCGALIFFPNLTIEETRCKRCDQIITSFKLAAVSTTKKFEKKLEYDEIQVKGARINTPCPMCNKMEMMYNTAQLRSADEGQTVFYSCDGCGYKETVQS